jgi:signal transduction histidine kinase
MRRRLILAIVSSVLLTGLLVGVPLVIFSERGLRSAAQERADIGAQRTVEVVELRLDQGLANDQATLAPYFVRSRQVSITFTDDGRTDVYGPAPSGPTVTSTASGPRTSVVVVEPIENIGSPTAIAWRIAATTLLAMLIAFLVSRRRARAIADDFEALARDAARIGSGDTRPARRHRFPELNEVADAMDSSSQRVNDMLRTERAFVSDVTHQLRTPLTAVSLRLDEIEEAPDLAAARWEAREAQEQVHRLAALVDDLLATARQREIDSFPFAIDDVLKQQAIEWAAVFARQGRELNVDYRTGAYVLGTPGACGQVLATLLENAFKHGIGNVDVHVRPVAGSAAIEVMDEGSGIPDQMRTSIFERAVSGTGSSGLGLSLARALAEHMGGRLELVRTQPTTFALFLRAAPLEGQADAGGLAEPEATAAVESAEAGASVATGNTHRR